jgi:hypothetical protein
MASAAFGTIVGVTLGWITPPVGAASVPEVRLLAANERVGAHDDHGNGVPILEHTADVDAVEGQVLNLSLRLGAVPGQSRDVTVLLELQTLKPRGEIINRTTVTNVPLTVVADTAIEVGPLRTPDDLPDGYYRTLIVYAAQTGGEVDEGFEEFHYRITDGVVELLEASDWREESGENTGTFLAGSDQADFVQEAIIEEDDALEDVPQ